MMKNGHVDNFCVYILAFNIQYVDASWQHFSSYTYCFKDNSIKELFFAFGYIQAKRSQCACFITTHVKYFCLTIFKPAK
jgi:hypothetical protein